MVRIATRGSDLVVRLSVLEKLFSLRGDIFVPLSSIRSVEVVEDALGAVRGIRALGYGLPFVSKVGTWRRKGATTFAVVHRWQRRGVRIVIDGHGYDEIVLGTADPEQLARSINARQVSE